MSRRKRSSNNPDGRPSRGLGEASVLVRLPAALRAAAVESARAAGLDAAAWWRQAALMRLARTPTDVGVPQSDVDAVT